MAAQLDLHSHWSDDSNHSWKNFTLPCPEIFIRIEKPIPTAVFPTYWQFAKKRQDVFYSQIFSMNRPVSSIDPIIERHRFTNVYRASDRVSQYLIRHVL